MSWETKRSQITNDNYKKRNDSANYPMYKVSIHLTSHENVMNLFMLCLF